MKGSAMCLDCVDMAELCDTCAFAALRVRWLFLHGEQPPQHLWEAARRWGGRHVLKQVRRQGYRYSAMVQRAPRRMVSNVDQ